jgi:hypothetical protein
MFASFDRACRKYEEFVDGFYDKLGRSTARYPYVWISIIVAIGIVCNIGFLNIHVCFMFIFICGWSIIFQLYF